MSDTVCSTGLMAALANPLSKDEREDLNERLYDEGANLSINYEGTIVYSEDRGDMYGLSFFDAPSVDVSEFYNRCVSNGLPAIRDTIRPYSCIWYNGADSDMDMLKLEDYRKRNRLLGAIQ